MFKSNKRGMTSEFLGKFISIFMGALIILSAIFLIYKFSDLFFQKDVICANSGQWDKVKSVIKNIESDSLYESFLFFNGDCKLASFTPSQQIQNYKIKPTHSLGKNPELCLCKIDGDLCKPYECHEFSDFNQILGKSGSQFTTFGAADYNTLKFIKDGKTLRIEGEIFKNPEPILYKYEQKYLALDETHLVDEMLTQFKTGDINSFLPIINIKKENIPNNIENIPGITKYFTFNLVIKPAEGMDLEDYKLNPELIDPNLIDVSLIIFRFDKTELESLSDKKLSLFSENNGIWKSTPMDCELIDNNYKCIAKLEGFGKNFVISKSPRQSGILQNVDSELLNYVDQISSLHNVNPTLVKSIIQAESNWNPKAVSPCGAAGIAQFIRATAINFGLNVPDYGQSPSPECRNLVTQNCRKDQNSLCKTEPNIEGVYEDERFNPKKSIEASVKYLAHIKIYLEQKGISATPAYIAAAYNQGEGAVANCKCIPKGEAQAYVLKVISNYQRILEGAISIPVNYNYLGQYNHGEARLSSEVNLIVLHHTGGNDLNGALEALKKRGLSAHYVVDRNGEVYYLVDEKYIAYHVKGGFNRNSIGIEIVNTGNSNDDYSEAQYSSIKEILRALTKKYNLQYNDNIIKGHYELEGNEDKWDPSPNFQWEKIGLNKRNNQISSFCSKRIPQNAGYNCNNIV